MTRAEVANMYYLGMDVGYSNLKIAAGDSGHINLLRRLPAGAGPVGDLAETVNGYKQAGGVQVDVRGDNWVAGVEPHLLWNHRREMHSSYSETMNRPGYPGDSIT